MLRRLFVLIHSLCLRTTPRVSDSDRWGARCERENRQVAKSQKSTQDACRNSCAFTIVRGVVGAAVSTACFRHFCAAGPISEGCDVVTVQRALGHGNASVTS
jgi:hypothetical protein